MKRNFLILAILGIWLASACSDVQKTGSSSTDPLPSWNDNGTKEAIIQFVREITNPESANFVPVSDRIAVFDNDGNLWPEKPAYFQLYFAIDRIKEMAHEHPEWKTEQPFRAVLEDDMEELLTHGEHGIIELVMASHAGMTTGEFEGIVRDWLASARHPRFDRPYTDLVYQPMLELLAYLQENEIKTFIVSGGGIEFMRAWVEEIYGIPRERVVGSSVKTELIIREGKPLINRLAEIDFINDKEGKVIGINRYIGRRPVFCSGNSDGDLAMMQWTAAGEDPRFMLYLHHTDSIREWAYDRNSSVGRLDKGLDEARSNGWTVIDMQEDWKHIYPFD